MKLEQFLAFEGQLVTLQFLEPWHALQYQGTMPDTDPQHGGQHLCHQAMVAHDSVDGEKFAEPLTTRVLGPAEVEVRRLERRIDPNAPATCALIIRAAGPDGSLIEFSCDPENVVFVGRCVHPGLPQGRVHEESRIVMP